MAYDDTAEKKPDPELINIALEKLSLGSYKRVPPNSVSAVQMSWFSDTALCFLESDRALLFPHHSYQRSSRAGRLFFFLPASCGLHQR